MLRLQLHNLSGAWYFKKLHTKKWLLEKVCGQIYIVICGPHLSGCIVDVSALLIQYQKTCRWYTIMSNLELRMCCCIQSCSIWNCTSAWVFSCKFAAYLQNIFSEEYICTAASEYLEEERRTCASKTHIFLYLYKALFPGNGEKIWRPPAKIGFEYIWFAII